MNLKRKYVYFIPFLLFILFISTIMSGCNKGNPKAASSSDDKVLRIGYQKNCPLVILKELGTLEKELKSHGYKVKWSEFQAGPALLEALSAGSIDFGRTGDSPPIFAQAAGSTLRYVASGISKYQGSGILVKNDGQIKSLADLKGKKIAFAKGSSSHFLLINALKKANISINDIEPAYLAPGDARIAFEQNKVDAWVVWDPFTADAEKLPNTKFLVNGKGLTSDRDYFVASSTFAKAHPDIIKVVLKEVQKSSDWANSHQKEAAELLSNLLGIEESSMLKAIERRTYGVEKITDEVINEQQHIADTFYELKIIPKKVNIKENVLNLNEN
ncbi:aliphatic sulfonate ABC transporter substrate-binding protein [Heyndrickxia sporothermodurans]|uniref:Putative aliphatic sulfonates-binding protein n=2 Tax=Heyndrickxia sporothermodurans TaxID=46224 RepID=A0AB37HFZ7_9BACI|nr:sulfonate ABC transporter substrate-binding protein [Heyndrickxia sporothermodurans]MBL5768722.1 sulfonate ABC transporter substrate-binding protein [Heyndrickxia sporothermodurans]MBL5772440.1 sulfonate ABC transporter substrate-binding protein [Heyndrickxia sporothermodurans]MBL5776137.1 sulfonate ABC transporter substrate-binding protein [Heyndrickxia sporothermodurans]MBL5779836.1 sulfonate ABC transporter substrate-binding protein [Heyndrickxia sporothermodurans]MBL5783231.1 sulfonate 